MMRCILTAAPKMLDVSACREWWLRRLHPAGAFCPSCGVAIDGRQLDSWHLDGRIHCNNCGRWYTNRTETLLDGSRFSWQQLFLMAALLSVPSTQKISTLQIATICGISTDSVVQWRARFRGDNG